MKNVRFAMSTTNLQIRVDQGLKADAERLFVEMGLDTPTAVRMFLKQAVINRSLPFDVSLDPVNSAGGKFSLDQSIAQADAGLTVGKTLEELEAMEK
jgi:DNA-damage-inducible protein J